MTGKQTILATLLLLLCFSLAACKDEGAQKGQMPAPPVGVFQVEAKDVPWPSEFQAQASGSRSVEVRARVQGIIEKRLYREGEFVKAGQLMFQIERDQYEAAVQQAEAQYDSAKREWNRVRPLFAKNAVSQKDRDNAKAAYDNAKAALRAAKINLDYCQVVSPVSGYSSKENYTPGNLVSNNSLLTYVEQTDPMYIDFSIAAPERMRRQQLAAEGRLRFPENNVYKARLRLLDGSMSPVEGVINFIDSRVQPTTGVIKARATFDNSTGSIMPGQYVRIFMEGDVLVDAVLIPQKSLLITQKGSFVLALDENNIVKSVPVTVSETIGDMYLVDSGLKGGEVIISEGLIKARPGQPVTPQDPNAQGKKDGAQKAAAGNDGAGKDDNAEKAAQ